MNVKILKYDITALEVDVIVNAANKRLMGGGGVDGAIHMAAGPNLALECRQKLEEKGMATLPTGQAIITKGYGLKAKYVIHTVGPIHGRDDIMLLRDCYMNSLKLAEENNCKSIAFPAISTGVYKVLIETSANIVKRVLEDYEHSTLETIMLVLFSDDDLKMYNKIFGVT